MTNTLVEYNDELHSSGESLPGEYQYGLAWVLGENNSEIFQQFSVYERYLIYVIFLCGYNSYEAARVLGRREHKTRDLKKFCKDEVSRVIGSLRRQNMLD